MRFPKPKHDWIILQEEEQSKDVLIHLPDGQAAKEANPKVVVAVGPGAMSEGGALIPMQCKVGERVWFNGMADGRMLDGRKYWVTRDTSVFASIEGERDADELAKLAEDKEGPNGPVVLS